jgi:hypothetical protein
MAMPAPLRHTRLATLIALAACAGDSSAGPVGPPAPQPPPVVLEGDVLFIGNSLTAQNDVPGMVESLADSAGTPGMRTAAFTRGGAALEDHWAQGTALQIIARGNWRFVVLQQGPSSLPASRANLRQWTERFAQRIRAVGAEPALYTVWPESERFTFFDEVIESYRLAAEDVEGVTLPAGAAWLEAWEREPELALYGPDGFHPTLEGSYLAALVIYGGLSGESPVGLPARFALPTGTVLEVPAPTALVLQQAAATALAAVLP